MKIASIHLDGDEIACIKMDDGYIPIPLINQRFQKDWPADLLSILISDKLQEVNDWFQINSDNLSTDFKELSISDESVSYAPLYRHPRKIWGIGLNYKAHAEDLSAKLPDTEPASFMKPDTTIIGHKETIKIPELSQRTTGEAELGLVFGKKCRNVRREDWQTVIAGFTTIIDMTAEDILKRNPRNLTQAKSFDTFFSFGPIFYTFDEVEDLFQLVVKTILNGKIQAENIIDNMTFPLDYLVAYHSQIMTMLPGDILSTGTPGAAVLQHGDRIECRLGDFHPLSNQVSDLKIERKR
jgi:2-keto-4-pentenoate hydratase/2-oxohepta-3-ene-1,7-dioic acid hydratase in catechol pathway